MEGRLAGPGVTTEFHAVSFQENPGKGRTVTNAERKAAFIAQLDDSPARAVRHHLLHRLDMRTPGSLAAALPTIRRVRVPYVSLNDHTPGQGQYRDVERLIKMAQAQQAMKNIRQTDAGWYRNRALAGMSDTEAVPAYYRQIAEAIKETHMVISTHDDDTVEKVDAQLVLGATNAEFPVTFEAAEHACAHGMTIIVGAPNIFRGSSQSGNLSAHDLIRRGLADAICADYHAPTLIPAAFKLVDDGLLDLPAAIRMITKTLAEAVGLHDWGAIETRRWADLALVRCDTTGLPHVEATFVAGRQTLSFGRFADETELEKYGV
jgi:alpha-D-ribose 1-methylphosphonate 5-triphosphate diphosphatase